MLNNCGKESTSLASGILLWVDKIRKSLTAQNRSAFNVLYFKNKKRLFFQEPKKLKRHQFDRVGQSVLIVLSKRRLLTGIVIYVCIKDKEKIILLFHQAFIH